MRFWSFAFIISVYLLAWRVSAEPPAVLSLVPANLGTNGNLIPYLQEIEKCIVTNTTASTSSLIATLEALHGPDLYTHNALMFCARTTPEERERAKQQMGMKGPPKHEVFLRIQQELMRRGGAPVLRAFERLLMADVLKPQDKQAVRTYILGQSHADVSFTLHANDRSQRHNYFLRFNPNKCRTLTVRKGDAIVQIAQAEYPQLSKWSAIEVIAFINSLPNPEKIRPDQSLKIYGYEVVNDELAGWVAREEANH